MKINELNRLEKEDGDQLEFPDVGGGIPNDSPKSQALERTIVIHAPANASLGGAVAGYRVKQNKDGSPRRSMHLFLGRDGVSVAQTVAFIDGANHTNGYNGKSIGIQLEYPGQLNETKSLPFDLERTFAESEYILASSINSSSYTSWPLFPTTQLETLLKICRALKQKYNIVDVVTVDEVTSSNNPGPAFPIVQFREKLLGVTERSYVLQELTQTVSLLGQPGNQASAPFPTPLPAGTQVSVLNEKGNWYLISEITTEESSWQIGWVKKEIVRINTNVIPVIQPEKHLMTTEEGRQFQQIWPHPNGFEPGKRNPEPKFIIMHFTTGTKMESTISHFKDPSSLVSTHLLIGRDGRVVQFLPFDHIAHHSGYSWWEQQSNLNNMSIGIEMDNTGVLRRNKKGEWARRGKTFTEDEVGQKVHWKQYTPKDPERIPGWEKFPPEQLAVALNVVKALRARYPSIVEILGHDDVNLHNRYDPGPFFPMPEFRQALFGRDEPIIKVYTINHDTEELYANYKGRTPNLKQGAFDQSLPERSTVKVLKEDDEFVLVTVLTTKNLGAKVTGWIQKSSLSDPSDKFRKAIKKGKKGEKIVDKRTTVINQPIFKRGDSTPTPPLKEGNLKDKRVRIQLIRGEWTLVVFIDPLNGRGGVEGWIRTEYVSPDVEL